MGESTEKSVSLDSARLFRARTVLAVLPGSVVSFLNPVEVRSGDRRLGWAAITVSPFTDEVIADLVFSYASPERLTIETGSGKLYGHLEGVVELDDEPWEHVGGIDGLAPDQRVVNVQILGIDIRMEPSYEGQPHLGEAVL